MGNKSSIEAFLVMLAAPTRWTKMGLRSRSTQVARNLKKMGITGYRFDGTTCPIAQVLQREFPPEHGRWGASYHSATAFGELDLRMPLPVQTFMMRFDRGRYRYLLRKSA